MGSSGINLRALLVVALGVATTIILLAIVPKQAPPSNQRAVVAPSATAATTPATTTTGRSGNPGTATTTTTFPVAGRPVLMLGASGPDVTALQQRLIALGYFTGTADGSFGAATQTAVMNFQKAKNLQADGVVGATTWAALATG